MTLEVKMSMNYRAWKSQKDGKGLGKARLNYLELLRNKDLPIPLKIDLLARVNQRAPALHSGKGVFNEISKIMTAYGASERNFAASSLNTTVAGLAKLDFPGQWQAYRSRKLR